MAGEGAIIPGGTGPNGQTGGETGAGARATDAGRIVQRGPDAAREDQSTDGKQLLIGPAGNAAGEGLDTSLKDLPRDTDEALGVIASGQHHDGGAREPAPSSEPGAPEPGDHPEEPGAPEPGDHPEEPTANGATPTEPETAAPGDHPAEPGAPEPTTTEGRKYTDEQLKAAGRRFPDQATNPGQERTDQEFVQHSVDEHRALLDIAASYGIKIVPAQIPERPTSGGRKDSRPEQIQHIAELAAISLAQQLSREAQDRMPDDPNAQVPTGEKTFWRKKDKLGPKDNSLERGRAILDAQGMVTISQDANGEYVVIASRLKSGDPSTYSINPNTGEMKITPSSKKEENGEYPQTRVVTSRANLDYNSRNAILEPYSNRRIGKNGADAERDALASLQKRFGNETTVTGVVKNFGDLGGEQAFIVVGGDLSTTDVRRAYKELGESSGPAKPVVIDKTQPEKPDLSNLGDIAEGRIKLEGVGPADVVGYPDRLAQMQKAVYFDSDGKSNFDDLTAAEKLEWFKANNISPDENNVYPEVRTTRRVKDADIPVHRKEEVRRLHERHLARVGRVNALRTTNFDLPMNILESEMGNIDDPAMLALLIDGNLNTPAADTDLAQIQEQVAKTISEREETSTDTRSDYALAREALAKRFKISQPLSEDATPEQRGDRYARNRVVDKIAGLMYKPTSVDKVNAVRNLERKPGETPDQYDARQAAEKAKLNPDEQQLANSTTEEGKTAPAQTLDQAATEIADITALRDQDEFNGENSGELRADYATRRANLLEGTSGPVRKIIESQLPPILQGDELVTLRGELAGIDDNGQLNQRLNELRTIYSKDPQGLAQLDKIAKRLLPAEAAGETHAEPSAEEQRRSLLATITKADIDQMPVARARELGLIAS